MLLTRAERNIVARVFAEYLLNPNLDFYPIGVQRVLERVGAISAGDPPLTRRDVEVAYEAQMIDLLYLPQEELRTGKETVSRTAFDIVVRHRKSLTCFELKYLSGWSPTQLKIERCDCDKIMRARGYDCCQLVFLYPSWRRPEWEKRAKAVERVKLTTWEVIRDVCLLLPRGDEVVRWMASVRMPMTITTEGHIGSNMYGLWEKWTSRQR